MASNSSSLGRSIAVSLVDLLDFLVAALVAMKTLHYESILARACLPGPCACCLRYSYLTVLPSSHRVTYPKRGSPRQALLQAPGKNLLGQLAANEDHLGGRLFGRGPRFAGFGAHHHVHTLEQHAAVDALHVQNALVTQQVRAIDLHHAAQEFLEAGRIERLVGAEHEGA